MRIAFSTASAPAIGEEHLIEIPGSQLGNEASGFTTHVERK